MARCIVILFTIMFVQSSSASTLLIWGDSLSAAYGIPQETAWPRLLDQKLQREGYRYQIVNASISGETSSGGLARLPAALSEHKPAIVIIELGANDGLRGLPIAAMRNNLDAMIRASQGAGAKVMLIGMRMPPNFGPIYTTKFQEIYGTLAKERKTALLPFMMEGFALREDLFQNDNLHPTSAAQTLILQNVWPALKPLLKK